MEKDIDKILEKFGKGHYNKNEAKQKLLNLHIVSQQRELLIAYSKFRINGASNIQHVDMVDEYLKIMSNL